MFICRIYNSHKCFLPGCTIGIQTYSATQANRNHHFKSPSCGKNTQKT